MSSRVIPQRLKSEEWSKLIEATRQAILAKDLQEAIKSAKALEPPIPILGKWIECIRDLVITFPTLETEVESLLHDLLAHGDNEKKFNLLSNIIRNFGELEFELKEASLKIVSKLLEQFPIMATYMKNNQNLFHKAADAGCSEIILAAKQGIADELLLSQALLQKDSSASSGNTPLAIAVRSKDLDTVKVLVEDAPPEMITPTLLFKTVSEGELRILQTLVGTRSNLITISLLEKAIPRGSIETWKYLLDLIQPHLVDSSDLLKTAVLGRRVEIVQSLMEKNPSLALWQDENGDRSILYYNSRADKSENPNVQQRIRDAIALRIIERCEPKVIRERLKDSCGYRREIGLDLTVLQNSPTELERLLTLIQTEIALYRSISKPEQNLRQDAIQELQRRNSDVSPIHIDFEVCLRYVTIPLWDKNGPTCPRATLEPRYEVRDILYWLQKRNVERILALQVLDSFHSPHTEETIELAVKPFDVKNLDWRRMDISVDTVLEAAANVEILSLYSSGNLATLSHWSGCDGIGRLTQLTTVTINIAIDLIGKTRAIHYCSKVRDRLATLKANLDAQWTFEVRPWTWGTPPKPHSEEPEPETPKMAPASVFHIEAFLESYQNCIRECPSDLFSRGLDMCRTKVAIIDSGVQRANITCRHATGASFVYNQERESPWWLSKEPHGTQMANIIHELDPHCELFIAKVGETKTGISSDSVLDAIEWAISKRVDVISMSLVLFKKSEKLTSIIERATGPKGIVMLCSTADDGNNYQTVYPASHPSVLAIAACNAFGKVTQYSTETASDYHFQGQDILTSVREDNYIAEKRVQVSGSSVATAMAAGIVSLIIGCHRILDESRGTQGKRETNVMVKQVLKSMVEKDSHYVQPRLFLNKDDKRSTSKQLQA